MDVHRTTLSTQEEHLHLILLRLGLEVENPLVFMTQMTWDLLMRAEPSEMYQCFCKGQSFDQLNPHITGYEQLADGIRKLLDTWCPKGDIIFEPGRIFRFNSA